MIKYRASCPICGWMLIQASPASEICIDCPKCKNHLQIEIDEYGVRIRKYAAQRSEAPASAQPVPAPR